MFKALRRRASPPVVEQRNIHLSGKEISYTLKRSGYRRSIGLRIDNRGLTVNAPLRASEKWLHSVLLEKAGWVIDKLDSWESKKAPPIEWAEGARIPFRGEEFVLQLVPKKRGAAAQLHGEVLHVPVGAEADAVAIEKSVTNWYRIEALQVFKECAEYFAPLLKVQPREIKLSTARTQWGSCTARGVVRLNWQLVKMPLHLIDYVVVHELAHLAEMNHSPAFWRVVESVCSGYKQCRAELHGYGVGE
ncbi:MAG: SprT family zinc-dependent metalloprotease [Gallionellaceae bacterium]|nr:SprT family zinc-dependent metalloprotease [Gallionellaceae bacterium]